MQIGQNSESTDQISLSKTAITTLDQGQYGRESLNRDVRAIKLEVSIEVYYRHHDEGVLLKHVVLIQDRGSCMSTDAECLIGVHKSDLWLGLCCFITN